MNTLVNICEDNKIEDMIYEIRGKQVMLDSDLAKLYGVETKQLNRQVKRNMERFDEDFIFVLTKEEYKSLRCQIGTSNGLNRGGRRTNPYVFTELGVTALAAVLNSSIAINTSKKIARAFVAMRHYIGDNNLRLSNIESKIIEHDNSIRLLKESFDKFEEKKKISEIYFNGQIFDAYYKIVEIFKEAKKELIIIDSYADINLLNIVKDLEVNVTLITTNRLLRKSDIDKYNKQYNNLRVIYDNTFHDRYFIHDNSIIYHCGSSINRIGYRTFSINLVSDDEICKLLIDRINSLDKKL